MTAKTALRKSIRHWAENIEHSKRGEQIHVSYSDCACCRAFIFSHCLGCPISKIAGERDCKNTPYQSYRTNPYLEFLYLLNVWYAMGYKGEPI